MARNITLTKTGLVPRVRKNDLKIFADKNGDLFSKTNSKTYKINQPLIPLSNTYWVNLDLTENDITNRIFKTYLDALEWIKENTTVSEANLQQIMLPAGNVGDITLHEGIRLSVTDGTVIENLRSEVTTAEDDYYNTVLKPPLADAQINNLVLEGNGKSCALYNCVVNNVVAATSPVILFANNCQFLAGDFANYTGFQSKCSYIPVLGDIDNLSINGNFNEIYGNVSDFELNCIDITATFSKIDPFSISGKLDIENCSCRNLGLSAEAQIRNSSVNYIQGTGTANISVENSTINNISLFETATLTHENSTVGTATANGQARIIRISEPFDNTISGLTAANVQDAIDELKALIDANAKV